MSVHRVTKADAVSALKMIDMFGTPEAAAHQCSVQLTAIQPYTDRRLTNLRAILHRVNDRSRVLLELLAADKEPERCADEDGRIFWREKRHDLGTV